MADIFDTWDRLSFGGIEFPYTDLSIKGSLRHHLHEYIKRPGGEVETLARRAYTITARCEFVDVFQGYIDLYPSRLSALISLCEQGFAQDLFIPQFGRAMKVKCTEWPRTISAAKRSGEQVEFTFLEDNSEQFTVLNLIGARTAALWPKAAVLQIEINKLGDFEAMNWLEKILDAIEAFLTAYDLATAEVEYVTARIDVVIGRLNRLAQLPVMALATSAAANTAMLGLWSVAVQIKSAQTAASRPLLGWRTNLPFMSVVDVSMFLFGSPAKSVEILRLNDLDDAFFIPFGKPIRYLAPV